MADYHGSECTVVNVLRDQVSKDPDRVWIVTEDERYSVARMDARSSALARGLSGLGVAAGDTVLVMLPNCIEFIDCWLALARLRAIQVPVNTAYFGAMLEHLVRDSRATRIVVHESYLEAVGEVAGKAGSLLDTMIVVGAAPGPAPAGPTPAGLRRVAYASLLDDAPAAASGGVMPAYNEVASIMYTSGTTGASKGVMVTHAHSYQYAAGGNSLQLGPGDVYYAPLPLFHVAGQWAVIYNCLIRGAAAVLKARFSITDFWSDVERFGVTTTFMLGAMGSMLFRTTPGHRRTSLAKVLMSPLIPEYREFCDKFGVQVCTSYASTEVNGVIATGFSPPNAATCGRVRSERFEVRLVDELDEEVPVGQVGELVVRPKLPWIVMAGYWNRPAETQAAWRNLWLHSGDLFRRDADGYYYFVDRLKDSIRRRGENISSVEVENAINSLPEVLESAVVPVPSELTEQEVLACVVFRPGQSLAMDALHTRIAALLPKFMVPRYLAVIDAVPKTPTGKPQKFRLRDEIRPGQLWDSLGEGRRG
ncbi:MAG: ATP-dependent acyl-CoA ligase [Hyphomicrobiales bacterium]|nr:MAG: ATP-dependent acyl-CoA ligase [Hyphomicrobiales bacterium]